MDFETILVIPTVLIRNGGSGSLTMKIRNGKYGQRKAISPIIATVLIIAVTLIAAVAIGGFVFGIFGTSSQSAQIAVTSTSLPATNFPGAGPSGTASCLTTGEATPYITLTNTGTASAQVTGVTITWAGASNAFAMSATCTVGGAGSTSATSYIQFATPKLATAAVAGQTYSGSVTLSNGAVVLFTGTWQ
jgi:flagellin-like protein